MITTDDEVLVEIDEKVVALVTLNRPERKNALHGRMLGTFIDTMWASTRCRPSAVPATR